MCDTRWERTIDHFFLYKKILFYFVQNFASGLPIFRIDLIDRLYRDRIEQLYRDRIDFTESIDSVAE
jgi:hypothetical protein